MVCLKVESRRCFFGLRIRLFRKFQNTGRGGLYFLFRDVIFPLCRHDFLWRDVPGARHVEVYTGL